MRRPPIAAWLLLAVQATANAQSAGEPPRFAAATIRRNVSGDLRVGAQTSPGGRVTLVNTPIRDVIRNVYALADAQIEGGPEWLSRERYDIVATAGADVPRQQLMLMVRTLLAERLKLVIHHETRQVSVYRLALAREDRRLGTQLRPTAIDCAGAERSGARQCGFDVSGGTLDATGMSIVSLMQRLTPLVGRTVVDGTGLDGLYDITLRWAPAGVADAGGPDPSLFTALREQLGLTLEDARAPVQVMVIDSVERPED